MSIFAVSWCKGNISCSIVQLFLLFLTATIKNSFDIIIRISGLSLFSLSRFASLNLSAPNRCLMRVQRFHLRYVCLPLFFRKSFIHKPRAEHARARLLSYCQRILYVYHIIDYKNCIIFYVNLVVDYCFCIIVYANLIAI